MEAQRLHTLLLIAQSSKPETERYIANEKAFRIIQKHFEKVFSKLCKDHKTPRHSEIAEDVYGDTMEDTVTDVREGIFIIEKFPKEKLIACLMFWMRQKADNFFKQEWEKIKKGRRDKKSPLSKNFSQLAGSPRGTDDGRVEQIEENVRSKQRSVLEDLEFSEKLKEIKETASKLSLRDAKMIDLLIESDGEPTEEEIESFKKVHALKDFPSGKNKARNNLKTLYKQKHKAQKNKALQTKK
jgi:hypothetical protein